MIPPRTTKCQIEATKNTLDSTKNPFESTKNNSASILRVLFEYPFVRPLKLSKLSQKYPGDKEIRGAILNKGVIPILDLLIEVLFAEEAKSKEDAKDEGEKGADGQEGDKKEKKKDEGNFRAMKVEASKKKLSKKRSEKRTKSATRKDKQGGGRQEHRRGDRRRQEGDQQQPGYVLCQFGAQV